MKVGDLVRLKVNKGEPEFLGIILEDDSVDNDGLFLVYFSGPNHINWFDNEDVEILK